MPLPPYTKVGQFTQMKSQLMSQLTSLSTARTKDQLSSILSEAQELLGKLALSLGEDMSSSNGTKSTPTESNSASRKYPEDKLLFKSGTTSTKKPLFQLIPYDGLVRAADRFELGLITHADKAWNALSPNQDALVDTEWLIERANHGIQHLYKLIAELKAGKFGDDDNAGAVAWCGLVLSAAVTKIEAQEASKIVHDVNEPNPNAEIFNLRVPGQPDGDGTYDAGFDHVCDPQQCHKVPPIGYSERSWKCPQCGESWYLAAIDGKWKRG